MGAILSRLVGLAIGLLVGLGLLWLAFRGTDLSSVTAALVGGHWTWPAGGVLLGTVLFVACKVARWRVLLASDSTTTTWDLLCPTTAGLALNALVPHSGEFVRAVSLQRRCGYKTSAVLASIVTERVFDLFAVLLLAAIALTQMSLPSALGGALRWVGILAAVGSALIVGVLVAPSGFRRLAQGCLRWVPTRWAEAVLGEVDAAIAGLLPIRRPATAVTVLAWSLGQWLAIALCAACCARVVGDPVGFAGAFLVVVGIVVAFLLPNAPGYAGSVQLAFVMSLSASGVPPAHAIAASIVYQALMICPVVVLGLVWLRRSLTPSRAS